MRSYANFNRRLAQRHDDWLIALHYNPQTRTCYRRTLGMFVDFLGNKSIASVTHMEIRQFMTQVAKDGASWSSTYRHLSVLRVFFDFLNLGGIVSYVAPRLVRLRAPRCELPPILSEKQIHQLIAATRTLRERALIETFYGTGCRLREVTHLKVGEVDLAARTARVIGKSRKVRTVLLTKRAAQALKAYIGDRQSGFVFRVDKPTQKGCLTSQHGHWMAHWRVYDGMGRIVLRKSKRLGSLGIVSPEIARRKFDSLLKGFNLVRSRQDEPLSNTTIQTIFGQVGARAGLKNVGPHMLRRSFATHLYDHGARLEVIQALLGHVFLETTLRYTRLSTGRLVKTFEHCHPRDQMNG